MSQDWYYSIDGSQQGPVTAAELKKLATDGKLKPEDLVWKDGMPEWKPANTIKGLFGGAATGGSSGGMPAAKNPEPVAKSPEPARRADDDDRPRRRRDEDEEDDDDRPRGRRDDDEDRPRRRRDEDDEDDRPSRRGRDDDDDDDRPRKKKRVPEDTANKKMVAGLLAILIGGLGIHKFYLGMATAGIIQIILTFVTCGAAGIIPLIEGIIYMTKSDEDFHREYVVRQKQWF